MKAKIASVPNGTHPYFVAFPLPDQGLDVKESITFTATEWRSADDTLPRPGQVVTLERITQFSRGWRAQAASPIELNRPETETAKALE